MTICVSFEQSLRVPGVGFPEWSAYGVITPPDCKGCDQYCNKPWSVAARNQWVNALRAAQAQIERKLKRPLCPKEVCNERHQLGCPIYLRNAPIAYLGKRLCEFQAVAQVEYADRSRRPCGLTPEEVDVCAACLGCPINQVALTTLLKADLPEWATADDIEVGYTHGDCPNYSAMTAPRPCIVETEDAFVLSWNKHTLLSPISEPQPLNGTAGFVSCLNVSICRIDDTQAIVAAGDCDCGCRTVCTCLCRPCTCGAAENGIKFTIGDAGIGQVCIDPATVGCKTKAVYVNYATAATCDGLSDDLVEAVVKLALTKLAPDSHVCSCDRFAQVVKYWNEVDPSASQAFAKDIWFGPQVGAMTAHRIISSAMATGTNGRSMAGGFFTSRPQKGRA